MKPRFLAQIQDISTNSLANFITNFAQEVQNILDARLLFKDNFKCTTVDHFFTTSSTTMQIKHSLGQKPIGYLHVATFGGNATSLFDPQSGKNWNENSIQLQSTQLNVTVRLIIIGG